MARELRLNCEYCDVDLPPPDSSGARIHTYEYTRFRPSPSPNLRS